MTFQSIFPACYSGRWPHIHFEVYPSLEAATDVANKIATSQIALPEDTCDEVYATAGYEQSVQNMRRRQPSRDKVFGEDGGERQLGTMTGSVDGGLTVDLAVPVQRLGDQPGAGRAGGLRRDRAPGRSAGRGACSPPARRPLCSYSLVIHGRRPRIAAAVSSANARSTYRSLT